MELNPEVMAQSREGLKRLDAMVRKASGADVPLDGAERDADAIAAFTAAMDDDLGTPEGVATMFETIRRANAALDAGDNAAAMLVATAIDLAGAMGLSVGPDGLGSGGDGGDPEIDALVSARTEARANKDFAEADRIRDELTARGIVVEDTPNGPVWHRS